MLKGTAPTRLILFSLLFGCGALCQKLPSADFPHGSAAGDVKLNSMRQMLTWKSLPDAPVAAPSNVPALRFGIAESAVRELDVSPIAAGLLRGPNPAALITQDVLHPRAHADFLSKYLRQPAHVQEALHAPLTGGGLIGRASLAASRTIITHDTAGKKRPNTHYIIDVLSAAAFHTANRPYWARSTSGTFNDFGSTIGTDAGMNVLHEFEPDLKQIGKAITPKFVFRLEARILNHIQPVRNPLAAPAR
jgi:hypothetical protein